MKVQSVIGLILLIICSQNLFADADVQCFDGKVLPMRDDDARAHYVMQTDTNQTTLGEYHKKGYQCVNVTGESTFLPTRDDDSQSLQTADEQSLLRVLQKGTTRQPDDDDEQAWGCGPGRAGKQCSLGLATVFHEHDPYRNFSPKPIDLQGWSVGPNIYNKVAKLAKARMIVEVGVWKGLSASYLASYLKEQNEGVLVAVDTWLGALEFWNRRWTNGKYDPSRDMMLKNGYPNVYYQFLSNVVRLNLAPFVIPFPSTSRMAQEFLAEQHAQADLIHIDAAHEYADVKEDIARWWPMLKKGGILLGDDYDKNWPGVMKAVDEFAQLMGLRLQTAENKWYFVK
eukprot:gnl/TRDRNA2_/TRDRNA2_154646_c0_seq2.p1 gnl/TRDRNA2_/TRDRNA2_154646_c0~~gnl/TRDRNA2_/TRDRNA2_154646_c0_seq2.p1  ORF type:complete len:341 (+),score=36.22 gnl/TRDRNA2_/TRDRNA2_154646_c0_seq2:67-1089(+)